MRKEYGVKKKNEQGSEKRWKTCGSGAEKDGNHGEMNMGKLREKREALECAGGMGRRSYSGRGRWW